MKKALFGLLVIAVGLSLACDQKPTGNTNANANRPLVTGTTHTVGINLALKPGKDTYHFEVAPEEVILKVDADQVQWVVTNYTDLTLSDVSIDHFKGRSTGNTDPFRNGGRFSYPAVNAHSSVGSEKTGISSILDIFDYEISGTLTLKDGSKVTVKLDPRIVVSS
jgi:hypothetical protein